MTVSTTTVTTRQPSLWRNRDFLALWGGQIVSTLGSRTSATALPLLVLAITGSPSSAGLVAAAGSLPYLVAHLPAGTLVDRWNRRRIMLTSEVVAGLALASVPVALWSNLLTIPQLMVVAFAQGTCFAFFGLAEQAALPRIVPTSLLPAALAQNEAKGRGAALVGPPLGGLLFSAGRALPFLADAVSYCTAAVGLLFVRKDLQAERTVRQESLWQETTAGLRWLWRSPLIRAAVLLVAASNLVFQALALVLVVLARQGGASAGTTGLMFGIYGGGGLLGALAAGALQRRFSPRTVIIGVNWIWAALLPLLALTSNPLLLGVIGGASAFLGPLWNVVFGTYQLSLVPDELMGRVGSAAMTLCWGVLPLGSIAAGYLLAGVGPAGTVLILTTVMLATALAATVSPAVRHAPPLPSGP
ncbi:MFS transporter [Streptacidiphilus sp. N1-10]|uniref:MFS transporter n=1 Tax=Streptacidiphilus jeojiensis TaxID=3229225 RepID=A0ABV6XVQ9_9ACTN